MAWVHDSIRQVAQHRCQRHDSSLVPQPGPISSGSETSVSLHLPLLLLPSPISRLLSLSHPHMHALSLARGLRSPHSLAVSWSWTPSYAFWPLTLIGPPPSCLDVSRLHLRLPCSLLGGSDAAQTLLSLACAIWAPWSPRPCCHGPSDTPRTTS
jgi:hypothetical protein